MGAAAVRRLCPHAVVVPPRFAAYTAASRAVFEIFADTTPLVENVSIDEAFLDVAGLRRLVGPPEAIGARLRARVRQEVGLSITVGIARTRFLAKVAGRVAKPDGLLLVPADREREFLQPLPVALLWGVGEAAASRLAARGITTFGDAAALPDAVLATIVGAAAARRLRAVADGRDAGRFRVGPRRRSIGSQTALGPRPRDCGQIDAILLAVVDRVMHRVREARCVGRTVVLRLRFDDYVAATRSHSLPMATAHTATVLAVARALLAAARPMIERRGLALLALALADVDRDAAVQLVLPWAAGGDSDSTLQAASDTVRARFGSDALRPASLLGRRCG
jgi:DNA polymerase-4